MRIRKRQVPLPLSSLLPVPLSDLYFNRSPTLFTDATGASSSLHLPPPLPTTKTTTSDHLIRGPSKKKKKKKKALYDDDDDDDDDDYDDGDVDFDVKSIDASTSSNNNLLPTASTQVVERWGEKSVKVESLRKRRGVNVSNFDEDDEEEEEEEEEGKKGIRKKGRRSNSLIEEGSRCSRVNGRGWRCCQQTLVGYSLCEHHLGKGRLRSLKTTSSSVLKKKRVKLGMVKARSISSLLGQTSSTTAGGESEITGAADQFVEFDDK